MSRKRRERRMSRRVMDRLFLATGLSDTNCSRMVPALTVRGNAAAQGGHTRRTMRVEQLESRVVLSSMPAVELFAPFCVPLDVSTVASTEQIPSDSNLRQYGPQQLATLVGPEYSTIEKSASSVAHLQLPEMPGLSALSSNLAGAIAQAWDIPADSMTDAWVVGLAAGQTPELLQQLGFETASQTPYLTNTFILEFAESTKRG